jgi:predicted RNase H-like HicB family nuclease
MPPGGYPQAARFADAMIATHHEYRGYVFRIEYQAQEPIYTVAFADFPEIITSGQSLASAFANACEALDLHLESLQKLGKRVPKPKHSLTVESV